MTPSGTATKEARVENGTAKEIVENVGYIILGVLAWASKQKLFKKISASSLHESSESGALPVELLNAKLDHLLSLAEISQNQYDGLKYDLDVMAKGLRRVVAQVDALQRAHRAGLGTEEPKGS